MVILKFCFIKFIFSNILYYTGQYGKEGLCNLYKKSFQLKVDPAGTEYIQMTFNDKKNKDQGDATSFAIDALHKRKNIIRVIM